MSSPPEPPLAAPHATIAACVRRRRSIIASLYAHIPLLGSSHVHPKISPRTFRHDDRRPSTDATHTCRFSSHRVDAPHGEPPVTGGFVGASVVVNAGALAAAVVVEVEGSSLVSATIAAVKPPSNFKPAAEFSSLATKLNKQMGQGV